ncbi:MAG: polyprenyl synthetase family protein [Capsulimonadales bacterium]|nr:polyprenyl synthetase family protein [Capsulimonadales bacterium]
MEATLTRTRPETNGISTADTPTKASPGHYLRCIEGDLARVEEILVQVTRSDIGAVRDISGHTLLSGGKRLRPALGLLCARLVGRDFPKERAYAGAAAAELIHMASLMHDDVVDSAPERRGVPTANSLYGNGITVLTGDYLFAKAVSLLVHNDENLRVIRIFSDITVGMTEGEVLQAAVARNPDIDMETYEEIIARKTASFLAGCCETGAIIGGATDDEASRLHAYGLHLGMAFQIVDDLLDFLGDPKKTGKPLGTDLRDGRVTLPLLHTIRVTDAETRQHIREILGRGSLSDADIAGVTATIARHGGFEQARRGAEEQVERAIDCLGRFSESAYRTALIEQARYVVARDR